VSQIVCSSVWIHAFEGDRSELLADRCRGIKLPAPTLQESVVYAGHAGVSFEDEEVIYGFLPHAPDLSAVDLLNQLKNEKQFPAQVADHKSFFEFAKANGRQVERRQYLYPNTTIAHIRSTIYSQTQSCTLMYAFPGVGGAFNCVTWLHEIGLQIPDSTGSMKNFMSEMQAMLQNAPVAIGGCVV
jgi:hypothetical protein